MSSQSRRSSQRWMNASDVRHTTLSGQVSHVYMSPRGRWLHVWTPVLRQAGHTRCRAIGLLMDTSLVFVIVIPSRSWVVKNSDRELTVEMNFHYVLDAWPVGQYSSQTCGLHSQSSTAVTHCLQIAAHFTDLGRMEAWVKLACSVNQ